MLLGGAVIAWPRRMVIQMACTHAAAMAVLAMLAGAHGFARNIAMKASAAGRLLRAYAAQVEALRRLRSGGSQSVRVEHVHVTRAGRPSSAPLLSDRISGAG
jgi:hypothetical protein